jgi:hypothetical protein
VVPRLAVVVGMPGLDGLFVEGACSGVACAPPSQASDATGWATTTNSARAHAATVPKLPGTEERADVEGPS